MLTLELELLTGAYRAALPDGSGPEWPPHPERVFSALVQAWGDGGAQDAERAALEWLERLPAPAIEASPQTDVESSRRVSSRDAPVVFVPPNDANGDDLRALPERRSRQQRTFHAAIPDSPVVRMQWQSQPDVDVERALGALAKRVASVGHSSSLSRVAFRADDISLDPQRTWTPAEHGSDPLRVPYEHRLMELSRWYCNSLEGTVERPRSPRSVRYAPPCTANDPEIVESTFGGPADWIVLEDNARDNSAPFRPDVLALGRVAKRLRDVLMTRGPQPPLEIVSGHAAGGGASQRPHLAFVPLANVGWEYSDGELFGMALVLPRRLDPNERHQVLLAIADALDTKNNTFGIDLQFRPGTWHLERSPWPSRASLRPERWCAVSRSWASVTPVLLDRFPEYDDPVEEARLLSDACRRIGLPEPDAIEIHKHSAVRGAPSAYPGRGRPHLPSWSFPDGSPLQSRPRRHVVLRFSREVRGPVFIGAGRYYGFGMCLPLEKESGR